MKIITIGNSAQYGIVVGEKEIETVLCQVIQDNDNHFHLAVFGDEVKVNGKEIKNKISISFDDRLKVNNCNVQWQSYFKSFCAECKISSCWIKLMNDDGTEELFPDDAFGSCYNKWKSESSSTMQEIEQIKLYIAKL